MVFLESLCNECFEIEKIEMFLKDIRIYRKIVSVMNLVFILVNLVILE